MWIFQSLLAVFFPPSCAVCKTSSSALCKSCARKLARTIHVLPLWIHATYSYKDDHVRHLMHEMKYYHRRDLIYPLVKESCTDTLAHFMYEYDNTILVPIPMHRARLWKRGYNHAKTIAKTYGKEFNVPVLSNLLYKTRETPQQAKIINRGDREKNVRGSIAVNKKYEHLREKHVILIDDTTTTFATLSSAKKVLEDAGWKHVRAIALAH